MKRKSSHHRRQKKADYNYKKSILNGQTPKSDVINQVIETLRSKGIEVKYDNNLFTITRTNETFSFDDVTAIIAETV